METHWHNIQKRKIKEMKRKQVLQTACFYLKKFGGYTSLLRKKMHIEQFPTWVFSFSVLPISYLFSHLSNSQRIKRARDRSHHRLRQNEPWRCSVVQLSDSRAVHWLLAHKREHFHMNNTWIDIGNSQTTTYWESLRN